jgi:hypothetical protein
MKNIVLILFQWIAVTALSAQTPTAADSSAAKFPHVGAYAGTKPGYKITNAPNSTFCYQFTGTPMGLIFFERMFDFVHP